LVVDADAVLALAITKKCFKAIPWQGGKISQRRGGFKAV
jgi:hypothetical protein